MAGTKEGGKAAGATNKAKYGKDFYAKIGAMGGKKGNTGGFYGNPEAASRAAAVGGKRSKRGYMFIRTDGQVNYYINRKTSEPYQEQIA